MKETKHATVKCGTTLVKLAAIMALALSFQSAYAQTSGTASEKSYREARRVLDAGITALGGLPAIRKVDDVSVKFSGINYARNQSASPDTAYFKGTIDGSLLLDSKGNRMTFQQVSTAPGFKFQGRQILKSEKGLNFDMTARTATPFTNPNGIATISRARFPHALLLTALDRAATLRSLGQDDFKGKKQNVVAFATSDGTQFTMYFDAATNLLTKLENLDTDSTAGDVTQEFIFPDYATAAGLKFPTGRIVRRGGEVTQEVKISDVQVNTHPAESVFERPDGFADLPANNPTPTPTVTELAKDVYLVQDAANG
ncbi:MAG: hypothetical protein ABI596_15890, partial [Pyrinomonadaceae bacterium]